MLTKIRLRAYLAIFTSVIALTTTCLLHIFHPNLAQGIGNQTAISVVQNSIVYTPSSNDPLPGAAYPRFIRLAYSGSLNGTLLATFEEYNNPSNPFFPIYRSTDGGATWSFYSQINDTHHNPAWGLRYQPHLYELPQQVGTLPAGTILAAGNSIPQDLSKTELDLYVSTDHGRSWSFMSMIVSGGAPQTSGSNPVWEPNLQVDAHGKLVCYYSDERKKAQGYNQLLAHQVSTNGGKTWGKEIYDAAIKNGNARPGMAVVTKMGNGQYAMTIEACNTSPNCSIHVKISSDGDNWGNPADLGPMVETQDGHYLVGTPYIAWAPTGGAHGTLYLSAKLEYNANGSIASDSGSILMANTNLGSGQWHAVTAPLQISPIAPGCNGWSQPLLPLGTTLMQMAATVLSGSTSRCEIRFASTSIR